jgi:hypothetical protein
MDMPRGGDITRKYNQLQVDTMRNINDNIMPFDINSNNNDNIDIKFNY